MIKNVRLLVFIVLVFSGFLLLSLGTGALFGNNILDLSAGRKYSLSEAGKQLAASIKEPLTINLYYSPQIDTDYPVTAKYFNTVQNLLKEYRDASHGQITLNVIYLSSDEKSALEAEKNHLKAFLGKDGKSSLYFGALIRNAEGRSILIPNFSDGRQNFIENDLNRAFTRLGTKEKPAKIGIMAPDLTFGKMYNGYLSNSGSWNILQPVAEEYILQNIPDSAVQIGVDINTVIVVSPGRGLSRLNLYALDQFLLRGGNLIIFADSYNEHLKSPYSAENLNKLLENAGLRIDVSQIAGDADKAGRIISDGREEKFYPLVWSSGDTINQSHILTRGLNILTYHTPAPLQISATENDRIVITPLVQTSDEALSISVDQYAATPKKLINGYYHANEKPHVLAALSEGNFKSMFDENILKGLPQADNMLSFLPESLKPGKILVIGDIDFLYNDQWSDSTSVNNNPVYGIVPFADNGSFLLRALDYFSGRNAFLRYNQSVPASDGIIENVFRKNNLARFGETGSGIRRALEENKAQYDKLNELSRVQPLSYMELKRLEELKMLISRGERDLQKTDYLIEHALQAQKRRFVLLNVFSMLLLMAGVICLFRRRINRNRRIFFREDINA